MIIIITFLISAEKKKKKIGRAEGGRIAITEISRVTQKNKKEDNNKNNNISKYIPIKTACEKGPAST